MEMNLPVALLQSPARRLGHPVPAGIEFEFSDQLRATYCPEQRAICSRWTAEPRPCFNPTLLRDIRSYYDFLTNSGGTVSDGTGEHPIEYVVLASDRKSTRLNSSH